MCMIIYIHFVFQIYSYQGSFTIYRMANSKNNTDFYFGNMGNFGSYFIFAYILRPTCSIKLTKQEAKKVHFLLCVAKYHLIYLHYLDKYLYLLPLLWSKTTLIPSCMGGAGENSPNNV